MNLRRVLKRLLCGARPAERRHAPPCVGCRGELDKLEPIELFDGPSSTPQSEVSPRPGLQAAEIAGQLVVLDPLAGSRVLLNAPAALIFTAFDRPRLIDDVVAQLVDETGADVDALTADVIATVDRLVAQGMLTDDGRDLGRSAATPPMARNAPTPRGSESTGVCDWAYDSGTLDLAGISVAVRIAVDPGPTLSGLLGAMPRRNESTPEHRIDLIPAPPGTTDGDAALSVQLVVDGRATGQIVPTRATELVVLDQLDQIGIDYGVGLRFHAGAVERDGRVAIVFGQSGDGKSTLTGALVQHGYGYLTDELTAVDPATESVVPYPRPLDLDDGSCGALGLESPDLVTEHRKNKVVAAQLGRLSTGGRPTLLVLLAGPSDETAKAGHVSVRPLPPAEALMAMLPVTFGMSFDDPGALDQLAKLCASTRAVRMERGPLAEMVAAVDEGLARNDLPGS